MNVINNYSLSVKLFLLGLVFVGLGVLLGKLGFFVSPEVSIIRQNKQSTIASDKNLTDESAVLGDESQLAAARVNINKATLTELIALDGIGQKLGQKIIDNRPYSDIAELVTKKIISKNVFEKIKVQLTIN